MNSVRHHLVRQILGLSAICLGLAACDDHSTIDPTSSPTTAPAVATRSGVSRDIVTIEEGQSTRIHALDGAAASRDITWSSADDEIAAVDTHGNIRGIAVGTTTLTVVSRNGSSDVVVTVLPVADVEDVQNDTQIR